MELSALNGNGTAGVTHAASHLEFGLNTRFHRDVGCRLVKYALGGLRKSGGTDECRCYQKTNLFHYLKLLKRLFKLVSS